MTGKELIFSLLDATRDDPKRGVITLRSLKNFINVACVGR